MTLKEKFKKQLDTATPPLNRPHYQAKQCEQIADEFAIEFAEWLVIQYNQDTIYSKYTTKELIEIFKTEKEL